MLGKRRWEQGLAGMHHCWVNSTRTNSFHTVGNRESNSHSIEEHSSQRIDCLYALLLFKLRTKNRISCQQKSFFKNDCNIGGLHRPPPLPPKKPRLQSSHHNVMLTLEPMPKWNFYIIPWEIIRILVTLEISAKLERNCLY